MFFIISESIRAAVLSGEAISGHHSEGRYYLSKTKEDIALLYKACRSIAAKCFSL